MTSQPDPKLKLAPGAWTGCKCEAYICTYWRSPSLGLPKGIYDPFEASSPSYSETANKETYLGGLCIVQIIRYKETPVGAYDELVFMPGFFRPENSKDKYARISRIYVSSRDSCYNGRNNWGIPKHLARFEFTTLSDKGQPLVASSKNQAMQVKVFPATSSDSSVAFFTATVRPMKWAPRIPFSSSWLTPVGLNPPLLQPPLPAAEDAAECGTREWINAVPKISGSGGVMCWIDMTSSEAGKTKDGDVVKESDNLLPKDIGRRWAKWLVAVRIEDATLDISEPKVFKLSS